MKAERVGHILHLTLNDASSRNAFSLKEARELRKHLDTDATAIVLSAEGRVFCSGGQLSDYAAMATGDEGREVNDEIRDILAQLAALAKPTACVIDGDVFGGGVELISCFDYVVASPHVQFGLWQRKIGLSFGWGGGARLEARLGSARLRHLALSTKPISAYEAKEIGLVDYLAHEHALLPHALAELTRLASLPTEPFATLKKFEASREASDFNKLWWNESHRSVLAKRR